MKNKKNVHKEKNNARKSTSVSDVKNKKQFAEIGIMFLIAFGIVVLLYGLFWLDGMSRSNNVSLEGIEPLSVGQTYEVFSSLERGVVAEFPETQAIVVEFSDLECPYCAQAQASVRATKEYYGEQVYFQFMHFPLTSLHPHAFDAAVAAVCAQQLGFGEMYRQVLFLQQSDLSGADLVSYAVDLGIDEASFRNCLDVASVQEQVASDMALGKSLGVSGTPTFIVFSGERQVTLRGAITSQELIAAIEEVSS